ncbi:umecyanin-like [Panicum miliaceum]|uniref:Umecyanin-like n=1 Tax=Panicum miliaceum TaxID=4540 RepID=A0A3L6RD82_PANMI|nr:umecyanin-like [Panicum miliaceum]
MSRRGQHALLLLSAVVASLVPGSTAGVYHIVGAGKGWRVPPNKTYYNDWARTRHISIGDKLSKLEGGGRRTKQGRKDSVR